MDKRIFFMILTVIGAVVILSASPLGLSLAQWHLSLTNGMGGDDFQSLIEGYIKSIQIIGALGVGFGMLKMNNKK